MDQQTITPTEIVDGLGGYLTSSHEFEAFGNEEHLSFYIDLYWQWKKVPPFTANPTQSFSATLWQKYWKRMGNWYIAYCRQYGKGDRLKMMFEMKNNFYLDIITELQDDVLGRLPMVAKVDGNVVSMDQSIRLLKEQLEYMAEIDLTMQPVADALMAMEYWSEMNKLIDEYQA